MTYDRSEDFDLTRPKNVAPMVNESKLSSNSRSYVSFESFFSFLLNFENFFLTEDFLLFLEIFDFGVDSESFSPKSWIGLAMVLMDFEVVEEPPRGKSWDDICFWILWFVG